MKEFIEKLIGRLGEQQAEAENEMHRLLSGDYTLPCSYDITDIKEITSESFKESIQIVNELAEEYNNGWIPCEVRLPEIEADVLLSLRSLDVYCGYRANTEGCFYVEGEGYVEFDNIIAWQPLPAPYKKGE